MLVVSARLFARRRAISSPDVHFLVGGDEPQLVDLRLELGDRLLEIQETECHGGEGCPERGPDG